MFESHYCQVRYEYKQLTHCSHLLRHANVTHWQGISTVILLCFYFYYNFTFINCIHCSKFNHCIFKSCGISTLADKGGKDCQFDGARKIKWCAHTWQNRKEHLLNGAHNTQLDRCQNDPFAWCSIIKYKDQVKESRKRFFSFYYCVQHCSISVTQCQQFIRTVFLAVITNINPTFATATCYIPTWNKCGTIFWPKQNIITAAEVQTHDLRIRSLPLHQLNIPQPNVCSPTLNHKQETAVNSKQTKKVKYNQSRT